MPPKTRGILIWFRLSLALDQSCLAETGPKPTSVSFAAIAAQVAVVFSTAITIVPEIIFGFMTTAITGFFAATIAITAATAATTALFLRITAHTYPPIH